MFDLIVDFIFFSFFGYISEVIYCGVRGHKSGKALHGPYCPIYGLGGILIINVIKYIDNNIVLVYVISTIMASATEYILSFLLELIFKQKWWDYSNRKFNINGRICLKNSLFFGVLGILIYYLYFPFKELVYSTLNINIFKVMIIIISCIMIIDAAITINEAIDIKRRLTIIDEEGINNEKNIKKRFKELTINSKRLFSNFKFKGKKAKIVKKYYDNKD